MPSPTIDDEHNAEEIRRNALVRASEAYADRPVFRALMDMAAQVSGFTLEACGFAGASVGIPVALKATDTTIAKAVSMVRERQAAHRAAVLNLELSEAGTGVPVDALTDDRFLHAYDVTLRAALRTYRDEKIRMFGRLLGSATQGDNVTDVDEYEELLAILDDLSLREIRALVILDRFQGPEGADWSDAGIESKRTAAAAFWNDYMLAVGAEARVREAEVGPLLNRLGRTGLFQLTGSWLGTNPDGCGYLTPRYYRLRDLIADADGTIIPVEPATSAGVDPGTPSPPDSLLDYPL